HAHGVLRGLADGDDGGAHREGRLRGEKIMRVGFIGLGLMGNHMATNVQKGGHDLVVHDLRPEAAKPHLSAGAKWADSPKQVAEAIWVGGDEEVFKRHKPVLDSMSDQPTYIGPIGAGSIAKLVHNCAGYAVQTALAEVFAMGVKAGLEPLALWKAVRKGANGRQRLYDRLGDNFLQNKYEPASFALRLAHKDVSLATAVGREFGVPMRLCELTLMEMTEALNRGWGERDSRVSMLLELERAGIQIKVDEAKVK